jgi:hypothetical protein
VRVQDEELTLPQFPRIIYPHDTVSILAATIHDGTAHLLQVLPYQLALLHDLVPIGNMQNPAIIIGQVLDHPCDLCSADPLLSVVKFVLAAQVDAVDQGLDLRDGQHAWQTEVPLEGEPGEEGLQGAVGAAPSVVVE